MKAVAFKEKDRMAGRRLLRMRCARFDLAARCRGIGQTLQS